MSKRASAEALAYTGRAGDNDVFVPADPVATVQRAYQALIKAAARAIEASLAAQVDETGEPILPTIPFLRRTMVRVQRGAELERMMRLQET